jgi:hypothetical protein
MLKTFLLAILVMIASTDVAVEVNNTTFRRQIVYTDCNGATTTLGVVDPLATNRFQTRLCRGAFSVKTRTSRAGPFDRISETFSVVEGERVVVIIADYGLNISKRVQ